jgi:bifunctional DNA primase/polymerase-like protein
VTARLDQALRLSRAGWHVLPCHSPDFEGCSCGGTNCSSPGKHPRTRRGLHDASTDPDVVKRWWRRWPLANVGVRTGAASGLVVIDIDPAHGGLETIRRLHAEHPLPRGLRVRTGSGGWHLYFAHPGHRISNSAGTVLGPGVDVRGDGGYVIAPPSGHVSGGEYRWVGQWELPELPTHLSELLRPADPSPPRRREPIRIDKALSAWAAKALEDESRQVRGAAAGGRNHRLNRAAFSLGQIVGAGLLDADTVSDHLGAAAMGAGLGAREATRTIRSGLRAGMRAPRAPVSPSTDLARPPEVDLDADLSIGSG